HTSSKRDWSSDVCSSDLPATRPGVCASRYPGCPVSIRAWHICPLEHQPCLGRPCSPQPLGRRIPTQQERVEGWYRIREANGAPHFHRHPTQRILLPKQCFPQHVWADHYLAILPQPTNTHTKGNIRFNRISADHRHER